MVEINQLKNAEYNYNINMSMSTYYKINLIPTMIERANDGQDH